MAASNVRRHGCLVGALCHCIQPGLYDSYKIDTHIQMYLNRAPEMELLIRHKE